MGKRGCYNTGYTGDNTDAIKSIVLFKNDKSFENGKSLSIETKTQTK